MTNKIAEKNRNGGIDFIRGLSIISVILLHINIILHFNEIPLGAMIPQKIFNIIFRSGYYGVIVFFVVSGFLITASSINRWGSLQGIQAAQFYRIRFARIVPCLIGLLITLSIFDLLHFKGFTITTTSLEQAIWSSLTFQINWLEAKTGYLPGSWDVLWSLSVEEVFYLFFPLLCLFAKNRMAFIISMLIFIVLGPLARCIFSDNDIWSDHSYLSCMDGIAFGCLAALFASKINMKSKLVLLFWLPGLLLFIFVFIFRTQAYHLGLSRIGLNVTILEMGISFILIALQSNLLQGYGCNRFSVMFRWFGKNSYEIYLTHMFVVIIMTNLFFKFHMPASCMVLWYFLILFISGVCGHVLAKCYSEPLNKLIRSKVERNTYREKNLRRELWRFE